MPYRVLIVDDEIDYLDSVKRYLFRAGLKNIRLDDDPRKTVSALGKGDIFDVALLDITLPHVSGIDLLEIIKKSTPTTECIMVSALAEARIASDCIRKGAYAYLVKPVSADDLINTINRALERRRFLEILNLNKTENLPSIKRLSSFDRIKTLSEKMFRLMKVAELHAANHDPILISGQMGTGKMLFAEAIHKSSPRFAYPLITINASEMEMSLQAVTSGDNWQDAINNVDKMKEAHKGTLLIQNLEELSPCVQEKLLAYIQEYASTNTSLAYNVRMVFTTTKDVKTLLDNKLFKKELYYHLNKSWLHLPPLRERREDISLLINTFFEEFRGWGGGADIDEDALSKLLDYDYPQNVAELKNIIISLISKVKDRRIAINDLPERVRNHNEEITYDPDIGVPRELLKDLSRNYLLREIWFPLEVENGHVAVIIDDPSNIIKQDEIKRILKKSDVTFLKSNKNEILKFIRRYYADSDRGQFDQIIEEVEEVRVEVERTDDEKDVSESDSVVRRIVNAMINDAHRMRSTDIHIEPDLHKRCVNIRFRVDGECVPYKSAPYNMRSAIVSRIKIMSDLDITERRLPQDGKIRIKLADGNVIELRVATLPTVSGLEDVSLRLLARNELVDLDSLNMPQQIQKEFLNIINKPYGLILCVGPTGSGKTTTLHAAIHRINRSMVRILTIEDPVEITQHGIRQVQVNRKIGLDFPMALRAFLRADPDIIMVGEMRDFETAKIGIEASLTGHLVFSTLHTNNAPETIVRLLDMGLDPYNFGDSLLGVVAQRLVKSLCSQCKELYQPTRDEIDAMVAECGSHNASRILMKEAEEMKFHKAKGCKKCGNTGYFGRIGIFELLVATESIKKLVIKRESADKIRDAAIGEGMSTLLEEGLMCAVKGLTDFEQVRRVCMR